MRCNRVALNTPYGKYAVFIAPCFAAKSNQSHRALFRFLSIKDRRHLHPLYCLLFTMPGIPSIYYGSEFGVAGEKSRNSDDALRPELDFPGLLKTGDWQLAATVSRLAALRANSQALQSGGYRQITVTPKQLAFLRESDGESVLVCINADSRSREISCDLNCFAGRTFSDILNPGCSIKAVSGKTAIPVDGNWARILSIKGETK